MPADWAGFKLESAPVAASFRGLLAENALRAIGAGEITAQQYAKITLSAVVLNG